MLGSLGQGTLLSKPAYYRMFFDKSVKGLSPGAAVTFRGVRIGQVSAIRLSESTAMNEEGVVTWPIEVSIEIDPSNLQLQDTGAKPSLLRTLKDHWNRRFHSQSLVDSWLNSLILERGMCARLEVLSLLTGQLYIQFDLLRDLALSKEEKDALQSHILPTRKSAIDQFYDNLSSTNLSAEFGTLRNSLKVLGDFVNSGKASQSLDDLHATLANVKVVTEETRGLVADVKQVVQRNVTPVEQLIKDANATMSNANRLLETLTKDAPELLAKSKETISQTGDNIRNVSAKVETTLDKLQGLTGQLQNATDLQNGPAAEVLTDLKATTGDMKRAFADLSAMLSVARQEVAPESATRQSVQRSLDEVQQAARAVRNLAETLERNPNALLWGNK
ncbi:MAG: MCE family protein [Victivallales bacterium]|nr:MCE family protein [Victivallales bacterium]